MSEILLTDEYINDIREQFKKWADFLNISFGLASFTFALACLGTKTPALNACFSLAVVTFIRYKGSHIFPSEILRLREAAKIDESSRVVLDGLQKKFMSMKAMVVDYPVFLLGYILLAVIAGSRALIPLLPFLQVYVGT